MRTSYWITIDEADGSNMHVSETMEQVMDFIGSSSRDFAVEKVTEEDVTLEVKFMLGCKEASGDAWQTE